MVRPFRQLVGLRVALRASVAAAVSIAGIGFAQAPPPAATSVVATTSTAEKPTKVETTAENGDAAHLIPAFTWGECCEWKLQVGGEVRWRHESRYNFDMNRRVGDNDKLSLLRTRVNFDLLYCDFVRTFVEIMDARVFDEDTDIRQTSHWDVHQAWVEMYSAKVSPFGVRVGRQELGLGERRLVETTRWGNLPRVHEGVRAFCRTEDTEINAFVVQPDIYDRRRGDEIVTGRRHRNEDEWFYGLYSTFKCSPHELDLYYLGLSDLNDDRTFPSPVTSEAGVPGTSDRHTVGSRLRGPLWKEAGCGELGYGLEGAYQFGHRSDDEIRAYMLHGDLNYKWDLPWKPKVILEGNIGSGDDRFRDGETNTFNPLFGSTHGPYGLIDFIRLQNMRELALVGSAEPTSKLKAQLEFHTFWLDSKTDAWYNASGANLGRDRACGSGRHIGHEVDAIITYKQNANLAWQAGAAHFFDGQFARNVGRRDGANWLYLQTTFNF